MPLKQRIMILVAKKQKMTKFETILQLIKIGFMIYFAIVAYKILCLLPDLLQRL